MGGAMARNKGARGERAVVKILQDIVTEEYSKVGLRPVELQRNLMQAYKTNGGEGNHDLVGVSWMALEVKHHETLHQAIFPRLPGNARTARDKRQVVSRYLW